MNPLTIRRNQSESVFIEASYNSIRISFQFRAHDDLEQVLCHKLARFLMHRAEQYSILRRVPVPGYHLSLLLTSKHFHVYNRDKLLDYIMDLHEDMDRIVMELKLYFNVRARKAARAFLSELNYVVIPKKEPHLVFKKFVRFADVQICL